MYVTINSINGVVPIPQTLSNEHKHKCYMLSGLNHFRPMYYKLCNSWVLMWNGCQNIFNIINLSSFSFSSNDRLVSSSAFKGRTAPSRHVSVLRQRTTTSDGRYVQRPRSFGVGAQSRKLTDRKNRGREWSWPAVVGFGWKGTMCSREDEKPWRPSFRKGPRVAAEEARKKAHPQRCGWSCNIH